MTPEDQKIADLREHYTFGELSRATVAENPFDQFDTWFQAARDYGVPEVNAMTLATVGPARMPSTRTVLLKGTGGGTGFDFYTNYDSRKGSELDKSAYAAVTFLWKEMERQVNVRGRVVKLSQEESEAYFHSRPRSSQIGAHVSNQSHEIPSREWLEDRTADFEKRYPEGEVIPLPENWGGCRLLPLAIEFWQGRPSRLHDRMEFRREGMDAEWALRRLSP